LILATYHAAEFGIRPDTGTDCTLALRQALARLPLAGVELVFAAGSYDFRSDHASNRFDYISNHDAGLKRVVFDLEGRSDWRIKADGAAFWFRDEVIPFRAESCQGLEIRGCCIDWRNPLTVEAQIVEVADDGVLLAMPAQVPYLVAGGRLFFGVSGEFFPVIRMMELDSARRAPAYASGDNFAHHEKVSSGWEFTWTFAKEAERRVRALGRMGHRPRVGNRVYFKFGRRVNPVIHLRGCEDVQLNDVRIHYAGAMGVLAERCRDVSLREVHVRPPPRSDRITSARADAVHFVSCSGRVSLAACRFEGQHDDGANVHGIYGRIVQAISARRILVERAHFQQLGQPLGEPGDAMRIVDAATLEPRADVRLIGAQEWNDRYVEVELDSPVGDGVAAGMGIENITRQPEVVVQRCLFRGNRARGILVGTARKVLIEDCEFSVPGSAIRVAPDCRHWFESGPVQDLVVRRNRFLDNNYATPGWPQWGLAAIDIVPDVEPASVLRAPPVVGSVTIAENVFTTFGPPVLNAVSVDSLRFEKNAISPSVAFPEGGVGAGLLQLAHCPRSAVADNNNQVAQPLVHEGPPKFGPVQVNRGYDEKAAQSSYE
jgi:hypothetical protein